VHRLSRVQGLVALQGDRISAPHALSEHQVAAECFERGSEVGGLWRYENDNGLSAAYASLRTNASRLRMQYPSFPVPASYGDFPHHSEMAAYLDAYADAFGLRRLIRFGTTVERLELDLGGRWWITIDDGSRRGYRPSSSRPWRCRKPGFGCKPGSSGRSRSASVRECVPTWIERPSSRFSGRRSPAG
jgi:dimethylaniline monooxygenase (N-oxide forming)